MKNVIGVDLSIKLRDFGYDIPGEDCYIRLYNEEEGDYWALVRYAVTNLQNYYYDDCIEWIIKASDEGKFGINWNSSIVEKIKSDFQDVFKTLSEDDVFWIITGLKDTYRYLKGKYTCEELQKANKECYDIIKEMLEVYPELKGYFYDPMVNGYELEEGTSDILECLWVSYVPEIVTAPSIFEVMSWFKSKHDIDFNITTDDGKLYNGIVPGHKEVDVTGVGSWEECFLKLVDKWMSVQ